MSEMENFNDSNYYLDNLDSNINKIINTYIKLVNIYLSLFKKNIATQKKYYIDYIFQRGLIVIKHIFTILLSNTNNLKFTYYHCEKGIYYYTEFISQIENENSFLKLNTCDAIIFVYKKTIYNINKKLVKNINNNNDNVKKIYELIVLLEKIINNETINEISSILQLIINNIDYIHKNLYFESNYDRNNMFEQLKTLILNID